MRLILSPLKTLLLLTLGMSSLCSVNVAAQTCATPLSLTNNDCDNYTVSDSIVWLSFNSGSGASWCDINISVPFSTPNAVTGAELYVGTCNSLTLVQSAFQDLENFVISSSISASTNYLIKVTQASVSSGQLNVCSNIVASAIPCAACTTDGCHLICNPDLEIAMWPDSSQAPGNFMPLNVCNWTRPFGTPDYFTANGPTPGTGPVGVPGNFAGTETAHSGIAYGGIYCYYWSSGNYREYIQQQLQAPLITGEWYTLTFWVSLSDYSWRGVNHLGAYLSPTQPTSSVGLLAVTPQVFSTTAITTINGWVPITGTFQAQGGEQWITIGSFETDAVQQHPAVVPAPTATNPYFPAVNTDPNLGSYYYIDDIQLVRAIEPCFTWLPHCDHVNFYNNNTACSQFILSESWDFGDPASGSNNFSSAANPTHAFTQNNASYTVTHTVQTQYGPYSCTVQITSQPGKPVASIVGWATNNCGEGTIAYVASPCNTGIQYSWTVSGGSPTSGTGCTINVDWSSQGGFIYLTAWDPQSDCFSYDTLEIPPCCQGPGIRIDNMAASQALLLYGSGNTITSPNDIFITGVFTVDVPIVFANCPLINMGGNTPIVLNPGQTITFVDCTTQVKCGYMWDGTYVSNTSSSVIINGGSVIQQAKNAVVSNNGGVFDIKNSTLQNNYKDIVVNGYNGTHTGVVRNTDFTMNASFLIAVPAFPVGHTKTVCGIEITDNANIKIGDGTQLGYRNRFTNILVGIRSEGSSTIVENAAFTNMQPTFLQQLTVPNAGTGIVSTGGRSFLFPFSLKVGGATGFSRCTFTDMRIAVDCYEPHAVDITGNNMSHMRMHAVRIQRDRSSIINVNNNFITNQTANFGFQTAIQMLECYQSTIWITSNTIRQPASVPNQNGTGIRVGLVTAGDVILNVVGNTIERTKTGIWIQRLVGKDHVYITSNTINYQKPNVQYTSLHEGVRVENCGGNVRVRYNLISKTNPSPANLSTPNNLRGVSVISSPATIVSHNILTRIGAGIYAEDLCSGSSFACNQLINCYNGFFFTGPGGRADIGDQLVHPTQANTPTPTGNTWTSSINADIAGGIVSPGIFWYYDTPLPPSTSVLSGSFNNLANTPTYSGNQSGCTIPQFLTPGPSPIVDRKQNAGTPVINPNSYAIGTQSSYNGRAHGHRMIKSNQSWMSLGSPQDSLYSGFYFFNENSNIGLFRNFEDMAAVDSTLAAGNILTNITDTNISETNLKVVYSIYQQTWMQGMYAFTPADSATLYTIATQSSADAGEAVYVARVLLGLLVDESASSQRTMPESLEEQQEQSISLYPNPANNTVNGTLGMDANQTAVVTVVDLQGKVVKSQSVAASGSFTIDVSDLDNGLYFFQIFIDGELVEALKLEIIHE